MQQQRYPASSTASVFRECTIAGAFTSLGNGISDCLSEHTFCIRQQLLDVDVNCEQQITDNRAPMTEPIMMWSASQAIMT